MVAGVVWPAVSVGGTELQNGCAPGPFANLLCLGGERVISKAVALTMLPTFGDQWRLAVPISSGRLAARTAGFRALGVGEKSLVDNAVVAARWRSRGKACFRSEPDRRRRWF